MIAIKGYKMPKDCINCVMQFGGWCGVSPPEIDERVAETVDDAIKQGKPDWCPLVEIEEKPVRHGRWIEKERYKLHGDEYCDCLCSECDHRITKPAGFYPNFCEDCGAKMK